MASTSLRRIQKELADIQKQPLKNISVNVDESAVTKWIVKFVGPSNSPYKGGSFQLSVEFGNDFPFKAPTFKYLTKVYHPNIDSDGNICLGLLKTENWKPATRLPTVLQALYDLLETPNPDDPLVASIADQYKTQPAEYEKTAKEYTARYAK